MTAEKRGCKTRQGHDGKKDAVEKRGSRRGWWAERAPRAPLQAAIPRALRTQVPPPTAAAASRPRPLRRVRRRPPPAPLCGTAGGAFTL
eukprot:363526-Chlamydomonas_euryale.AAC.1